MPNKTKHAKLVALLLTGLSIQTAQLNAAGKPTEESVLPLTHTCSATLKFRAQDMTAQQFNDSCDKLGLQESYFHQTLQTLSIPVDNDLNEDLKMVVFDNYDQYNRYAGRIYGINTNNGGIYIEGNATDPNNQAAFYAHEADWLRPEFVIWNLQHEYVHYLDGRFDLKGNFSDYPSTTVWWAEGLAEYISKKEDNIDAIALINSNGNNRSLNAVFNTTYSNTTEEIYDWGYLGNRFMFENHPQDIQDLRAITRDGNWNAYSNYLANWSASYEQEWQAWLISIADGGDNGGGSTTTLLDTSASASAKSWNRYVVEIPQAGKITVKINGGSGDADLYGLTGSAPDLNNWDCRPYLSGNQEVCTVTVNGPVSYHIGLYAYRRFSGVNLTVTLSN